MVATHDAANVGDDGHASTPGHGSGSPHVPHSRIPTHAPASTGMQSPALAAPVLQSPRYPPALASYGAQGEASSPIQAHGMTVGSPFQATHGPHGMPFQQPQAIPVMNPNALYAHPLQSTPFQPTAAPHSTHSGSPLPSSAYLTAAHSPINGGHYGPKYAPGYPQPFAGYPHMSHGYNAHMPHTPNGNYMAYTPGHAAAYYPPPLPISSTTLSPKDLLGISRLRHTVPNLDGDNLKAWKDELLTQLKPYHIGQYLTTSIPEPGRIAMPANRSYLETAGDTAPTGLQDDPAWLMWSACETAAREAIRCTVRSDILLPHRGLWSAHDIFLALLDQHEKDAERECERLLDSLRAMRLRSWTPELMKEFQLKFEVLRAQLIQQGEDIKDSKCLTIFLRALPEPYSSTFGMLIENRNFTWADVSREFKQQIRRTQETDHYSTSLAATSLASIDHKGSGGAHRDPGGASRKQNTSCSFCNKHGHKEAECRRKRADTKDVENIDTSDSGDLSILGSLGAITELSATTPASPPKDPTADILLILDSGASHHIISDTRLMPRGSRPLTTPKRFNLAGTKFSISASRIGDFSVYGVPFANDVYVADQPTHNLIALRRIRAHGWKVNDDKRILRNVNHPQLRIPLVEMPDMRLAIRVRTTPRSTTTTAPSPQATQVSTPSTPEPAAEPEPTSTDGRARQDTVTAHDPLQYLGENNFQPPSINRGTASTANQAREQGSIKPAIPSTTGIGTDDRATRPSVFDYGSLARLKHNVPNSNHLGILCT